MLLSVSRILCNTKVSECQRSRTTPVPSVWHLQLQPTMTAQHSLSVAIQPNPEYILHHGLRNEGTLSLLSVSEHYYYFNASDYPSLECMRTVLYANL